MEIYKLTAIQPGILIKEIILRAGSPIRAREIATEATRRTADKLVTVDQDSPGDVWMKDANEKTKAGSKCEIYQNNNYAKNGSEEILLPKSLQNDWQEIKNSKK